MTDETSKYVALLTSISETDREPVRALALAIINAAFPDGGTIAITMTAMNVAMAMMITEAFPNTPEALEYTIALLRENYKRAQRPVN